MALITAPGNWATALGDALLQGSQAMQQEDLTQKQEARQRMLDQSQLQTAALNRALAQKGADLDAAKFAQEQQQQNITNAGNIVSNLPDNSVVGPDVTKMIQGTPYAAFLKPMEAQANMPAPPGPGYATTMLPIGSKASMGAANLSASLQRAQLRSQTQMDVANDRLQVMQAQQAFDRAKLDWQKAAKSQDQSLRAQKQQDYEVAQQQLNGWRNKLLEHSNILDSLDAQGIGMRSAFDPTAITPPPSINPLPAPTFNPPAPPPALAPPPAATGGGAVPTTTSVRPPATPPTSGGVPKWQVDASGLSPNPLPPMTLQQAQAALAARSGVSPAFQALAPTGMALANQPGLAAAINSFITAKNPVPSLQGIPSAPPPSSANPAADIARRNNAAMLLQQLGYKNITPDMVTTFLQNNPNFK